MYCFENWSGGLSPPPLARSALIERRYSNPDNFPEASALSEMRKNWIMLSLNRIRGHIGPIRTAPCYLRRKPPVWR